MERDEKQLDNEIKQNIPRNPNQRITDEEVDEILKKAAKQVEEKYNKAKAKPEPKEPVKKDPPKPQPKNPQPKEPVKKETKQEKVQPKEPIEKETKQEKVQPKEPKKEPVKNEQKKMDMVGKNLVEQPEKKVSENKQQEKQPENKQLEKKQPGKQPEKNQPEKEQLVKKEKQDADKGLEQLLEEEPVVIKNVSQMEDPYKEKITIGRVIGTFFETIWTVFKLAVLVLVVTGVVGFFLSRDMMIRGRNGNRQSTEGMTVSVNVATNKSNEKSKVKKWQKGITKEKITLTADDNRILVARKIVVDEESDKWAVILHGYNESMADVYDIAMHYTKEGYNVLLPDLRAHGESEGSFLGMGWLDRLDVINWVDVIIKDYPSANIVIHGVDIGADTALMLSGEPLKSSIKAIVAEGAYTSAWDAVKPEYKARHEKWPVFPLMNMMNPVMKVWAGYSLKEADAVKQVKNSKVPILLIHGENDTYATGDMTDKLNQEIASEHEVFTVTTGSHGDCRYAEPDNYYNKTFDFVGKYVN